MHFLFPPSSRIRIQALRIQIAKSHKFEIDLHLEPASATGTNLAHYFDQQLPRDDC